jgi:hypothetical protein
MKNQEQRRNSASVPITLDHERNNLSIHLPSLHSAAGLRTAGTGKATHAHRHMGKLFSPRSFSALVLCPWLKKQLPNSNLINVTGFFQMRQADL